MAYYRMIDQLKLNPAHQLVVWRMRLLTRESHSALRVCTSVLFIFLAGQGVFTLQFTLALTTFDIADDHVRKYF